MKRNVRQFPAITLSANSSCTTAIANDYQLSEIYSKQVRALGQSDDILIAICPSGHSANVIKAIEAALSRDMTIIALTGSDGGEIAGLIGEMDVEIRVPSSRKARVDEVHQLIIHCLCETIDNTLFPQSDEMESIS